MRGHLDSSLSLRTLWALWPIDFFAASMARWDLSRGP